MAVFLPSEEPQIQIEIGDYQEFPNTDDKERLTEMSPKSEEPQLQMEIGDYQEFPNTDDKERLTEKSPKSEEPQIQMEIGDYQEFPNTDDKERLTEKSPKSERRNLSLVIFTLGLLCLIQAILNISLRLALGENSCLQGWIVFGSSCYYVSSERRSWNKSREECQERGADLVIINSREELEFLLRQKKAAWVGMTDRAKEGIWTWIDGTPVTTDPSFWARGQPDGAFGGEDCGDIRAMEEFVGLNDFRCSALSHWICENNCGRQ